MDLLQRFKLVTWLYDVMPEVTWLDTLPNRKLWHFTIGSRDFWMKWCHVTVVKWRHQSGNVSKRRVSGIFSLLSKTKVLYKHGACLAIAWTGIYGLWTPQLTSAPAVAAQLSRGLRRRAPEIPDPKTHNSKLLKYPKISVPRAPVAVIQF